MSLPLIVPLATVDPSADPVDLALLATLVGDARVVALGECTHGTAEVFSAKARLVHALVGLGFDTFAIEASAPDSFPVDAYLRGADLEPATVVRGMGFWTWSTPEVRDLATWMRDANGPRDPSDPLRWLGIDMQRPQSAAAWLAKALADRDPPLAGELRSLVAGKEAFAAATLGIPVASAARFELSGWIRTADLDGSAAVWARGDSAAGPTAFDNLAGRGPRGTQPWSRYTVALDLPAGTERVAFGLLVDGSGTAWFDGLTVTMDGTPWSPPDGVDLEFEAAIPVGTSETAPIVPSDGWVAGGPLTAWTSDPEGRDGASLRVTRTLPRPSPARIAAVAADLNARQIPDLDPITAQELKIAATTMAQGWDAESELRRARDRYMADNVLAWLDMLGPEARIVVWAHNGHVRRREGWMGGYLAERLGDDYLPLGFACGSGTYTAATAGQRGLQTHELMSPPRRSLEAHIEDTVPIGIIDLRADDLPAWLRHRQGMRSIGAVASKHQFEHAVLPDQYDLVLYLAETTAASQLP